MLVGGVCGAHVGESSSEEATLSCDWLTSARKSAVGGVLYEIVSVKIDQSGVSMEGSRLVVVVLFPGSRVVLI